ncbi:30S ribosomal protein S5 [archaeon]|nr:30S ribosomal protein S5 [archaeon]
MVEKEKPKVIETPVGIRRDSGFDKESWKPKTEIGRKVKINEITDIDEIYDNGLKILETGIVDALLPNLESELLSVGQSKGKFGGGKPSIWKQTQKKTKEGNKPKFATVTIVGNKDGFIGIGHGKSKETMPAREKGLRNAKLNLIRIKRGCGSWACGCGTPHSVPFKVQGKMGSCIVTILPASKGTGLSAEKECKKILTLAGIKDAYVKAKNTSTKINLVKACVNALEQLSNFKIHPDYIKKAGVVTGKKE